MDIFVITLISVCVILSAATAFFYADSRGRRAIINNQRDLLDHYKSELREWQNKALFRQGVSPLGLETAEVKTPKDPLASMRPKVATRAMRKSMMERQEADRSSVITIHANEIKTPRVSDIVEKAREIKKQMEIQAE